jgi:hypothetical protein
LGGARLDIYDCVGVVTIITAALAVVDIVYTARVLTDTFVTTIAI